MRAAQKEERRGTDAYMGLSLDGRDVEGVESGGGDAGGEEEEGGRRRRGQQPLRPGVHRSSSFFPSLFGCFSFLFPHRRAKGLFDHRTVVSHV